MKEEGGAERDKVGMKHVCVTLTWATKSTHLRLRVALSLRKKNTKLKSARFLAVSSISKGPPHKTCRSCLNNSHLNDKNSNKEASHLGNRIS